MRVYRRTRAPVTGAPVSGERARPIQALIWYPASGKGTPMVYRDYVATIPTEDRFDLDGAQVKRAVDGIIADRARGACAG